MKKKVVCSNTLEVTISPTTIQPGSKTIVADISDVPACPALYTFKKNGIAQQIGSLPTWDATDLIAGDNIICEVSLETCSPSSVLISNTVVIGAETPIDICQAVIPAEDISQPCGVSTTLHSQVRTMYKITQGSCTPIAHVNPTNLPLSDDQVSSNINVGFSFNFFGTIYTQCRIHSNGIVSFGNQTYSGYTSVTIPNGSASPNNYIAGIYADLNPACGGSISYETLGVSPYRKFVVTYTDIRPYKSGCSAPLSQSVSFQIILEETTNLVKILTIHFPKEFLAGFFQEANATQGIEANDGSIAFAVPGRNWQVWNNPSITPSHKDCVSFEPINYTANFLHWQTENVVVNSSNPYTFNATETKDYTAVWNLNGNICYDTLRVEVLNIPSIDTLTLTKITNCTSPNGKISFTFTNVPNGIYAMSFKRNGVNTTKSISVLNAEGILQNLSEGDYTNFSVNVGGCIAQTSLSCTITKNYPTAYNTEICQNTTGLLTCETCDNGASIRWYTQASGGIAIATGSPFNPIGVPNSGLTNTSVVGTTTYYAACSNSTNCRVPVNFVIKPNLLPIGQLLPAKVTNSNQTMSVTITGSNSGNIQYNFKVDGISKQNSLSHVWEATDLEVGQVISCEITFLDAGCYAANTITTNDAIVQNLPFVSGLREKSLLFKNVANQYFTIPDKNILDLTNHYTIEVWVRFNNLSNLVSIINKKNASNNGYYLMKDGKKLLFNGMETEDLPINTTDWYHIAVVAHDKQKHLYLNGVEQKLDGDNLETFTNDSPLFIGFDEDTGSYFDGELDEIRIWNVARSQFDLRENMHLVLTGLEAGLIAYYQCNESESDAQILRDALGINHGEVQNDIERIVSKANVGRGKSQTILINNSGDYDFEDTGCSLNFWEIPDGDIVVSRIEGVPPGNNIPQPNTTVKKVYSKHYWVINNFGIKKDVQVLPTFILGENGMSLNITEALNGLKMGKRPTNKDTIFTAYPIQSVNDINEENLTFKDIDGFSEFVIYLIDSSPLASVSLKLYGKEVDEQKIELLWETIERFSHFDVEKSDDGITFYKITSVQGKDILNGSAKYIVDVWHKQSAYYRIKAYDYINTSFIF
jgi:hypothetical protein